MRKNAIKKSKNSYMNNYWDLYLFVLPGILFLLVFNYIPMLGSVIAFQDYKLGAGFFEGSWVGLKHFIKFFGHRDFKMILTNTLSINILKLIFGFPMPIIFALILNEIKNTTFKRGVQTITYLPHFLSWVIIGGILVYILSTSNGLINQVRTMMGLETIPYLTSSKYFKPILVISEMWKTTGWGTIIYLAAITSLDPALYEAAKIDGAGKLKQAWHITIPGIASTIVILFILRIGIIMNGSFEQVFMLLNPSVRTSGEIISTYIYRVGVVNMRYSYTTAVGLFQSLVSLFLVASTNIIAKKLGGEGIW